jgi:two-component system, sensor histidine kinase and response regulator
MDYGEDMTNGGSKQVILIVDDQATNLKILSSVLSKQYSLSLANSGLNALKYLEQKKPDLILLDIMMPGMDGYEVCSRIKENESTKDIPVVFLTAKTSIEDVVKGFNHDAVDYIIKPFNITELKVRVRNHLNLQQARQQLQKANFELQKLNQEKDRFFSIIAHDLRGPLSGFSLLSELLLTQIREKNYSMVEEYASAMQESSVVTLELLQNLMDWARSKTDDLSYNPQRLVLKSIFEANTAMLLSEAERKSIIVENTIADHIHINADKDMMGVIIRNLISNAIKFSNPGGLVSIAAENHETETIFSVRDNGIGMSETMISNLFRLDKSVRRPGTAKEPSSGLGLVLCKEFTEKHGGNFWVESKENYGTNVNVSIPV